MTTQEIYILNKRLKLLHSEKGFKTSMDSVFLGAACVAKAGDNVLDMGCGVGGAGFCVLRRVQGVHLTGVEIQEDHAELARINATENGFEDRAEFVTSDIREYRQEKAFHHVICNPPYLDNGAHLRSPHEEKAIAMGGVSSSPHTSSSLGLTEGSQDVGPDPSVKPKDDIITIKDWIDTAHFCLKSKGSMTFIHRADQLDVMIRAMGKRFGAIEVIPLWPKTGVAAKRVIIRAYKDRYSPLTLHAGIVMHQENGDYTDVAEGILREMKTLFPHPTSSKT